MDKSPDQGPIDKVLSDVTRSVVPTLAEWNVSPNAVTTASLAFGVLAAYALLWGHIWLFVIAMLVSYMLDIMDGQLARYANATSAFGSALDHFSDLAVVLLLGYVVLFRLRLHRRAPLLMVSIAVLMVLGTIHTGCEQKFYVDHDDSDVLASAMGAICPSKDWVHTLKFFSSGTMVLFAIGAIAYAASLDKTRHI